MSIKPWQAMLLPTLIVLGIPTYAAIDGQLGATSTATLNISLTVLPKIQIKQLDDFHMTVAEDGNPSTVQQTKAGCVVTNTQSGYYTLSASNSQGQAVNGYYHLQDSNGRSINYKISAGNTGENMQSITNQSVRLKATNEEDCSAGKNLQVKVQLADDAQLKPGQYGDVVQLQVVPI